MPASIRPLLEMVVARDASDLHLKVGNRPGLRVNGVLAAIDGQPPLNTETMNDLVNELLTTPEQHAHYAKNLEIDFSYGVDGLARFRVNLFHQRGKPGGALRRIPFNIPPLESLGFPPAVNDLCHKPRGLVLVTGPTGSGKSTTLASMIDHINRTECGHILTLEDPIEFLHQDKSCYLNQREIGTDTRSFAAALRAALREDPNVILVGEMRDLETIGLAITAAETGHLVFGTLHTTGAVQTVDRMVDVFPHEAQQQVRMQLSVTLQGVISQTLMPKVGGGRICAQEIMVGTDAVRSLIREGKTAQLGNVLQTGTQFGMQTLEAHLAKLCSQGLITADDALSKANNPQSVLSLMGRGPLAPATPATPVSPQPGAVPVGATKSPKGSSLGNEEFERFRQMRANKEVK
jgi:twitching motility protein PilT